MSTTTPITESLIGLDGWGQRSSTVRFELLDKTNTQIGTVDVDKSSTPTVDVSINRTSKKTLNNLRLPPSVTADINTLTERIRPVWVFQDASEFELGVYAFADASRHRALFGSVQFAEVGTGFTTDATLTDLTLVVDDASGGVTMYRPGTSVYAALVEQLEVSGITDYQIDYTAAKIRGTEWMVWSPEKTRVQIINDLAKVGGYYSLYFDNHGTAILKLVPDLNTIDPDITYDLLGGNVDQDSVVETDDLLDAPNRYLVMNSSLSDGAVWGYWDIPATAPHSFANRGIRKTKNIDLQGVESMAEAAAAAKAQGQADWSTYRWVNFTSAPNPTHEPFMVIGWDNDKYREQSYNLPLFEGSHMKHELRRVWSDNAPGTAE
jgi:hypothetical protein